MTHSTAAVLPLKPLNINIIATSCSLVTMTTSCIPHTSSESHMVQYCLSMVNISIWTAAQPVCTVWELGEGLMTFEVVLMWWLLGYTAS